MGFFNRSTDKEYERFLYFLISIGIVLVIVIYIFITSGDYLILNDAWRIVKSSWWFVLPVPIWIMYDRAWGEYRWTTFRTIRSREYIFLQVIPPDDIERGPQGMEAIFTGMHTWSKPNFFEIYCGWRIGQDRFAFEIIGDGTHGVRFVLRIPKMGQDLVEALIYAQYPEAKIKEIDNYTEDTPKDIPNKNWDLWGTVLKLLDADCIPIRSYREFQDDITGEAISPTASLMEVMSKLSKDERLWFQIIFSPRNEPDWVPQANAKIREIMEKFIQESGGNIEEDGFNVNQLPPGEQDAIKAIKKSLSRVAYKSTLRFVYLGKREVFNKATGVGGTMGGIIKQLNDNNLNSFIPDNRTKTFANYHFQATRLAYRQRKIFNDFKGINRAGISYTLTAEELATIYHFPNMNVKASALEQVENRKGHAPPNLPTE